MSLIAFLLLATAPEAVEDITVVGERLKSVSVAVARDPSGRYGCSINQTTGNIWLDTRLCEAATTCVQKGAETSDAVNACVTQRKPDLLAEVRSGTAAARP
ncbi:hypothetical protein BH10PSE13_BH10PSE13_14850 [soil metagenome]